MIRNNPLKRTMNELTELITSDVVVYNMVLTFYVSDQSVNFSLRWLCYCHVPLFCDSLQRHEVTAIFGQNMLKSIFSLMKQQLLDKFSAEKEKLPPDTRMMVLTYFPRLIFVLFCFLSYFSH